eukprot:TRINITY_DN13196_c0_g1::TRINITY_DN13196_c0_g1_i1::g.31070::m.31070 TRINITY_DN13196_c0_g1::TRINITY_DN13196_c0_g1_i1::g.31070  ORF type:complete len:384 (-),score=97.91,sp/Q8T277/PRKAG_DICDI/22.38/4e-06,CBS/PF00571.23/0.089,CBS/PF00571.23/3.7e-07,CBS/PF00571.23/0.0088,CBS/PF00571.23/8.6e-10,STN/PF07660.9/15,STN/PF07660.9/2e+03,STN/PF07660.9/13,Y_phosphatase2/PF03162.8/0.6,Y_phosphatase2/PF03162.8/2.3e+03,Y_phosphatase2/PF03162.8/2.9e+02 TRINITY_DN13196_c0_g1_i1:78-1190(-)
MVKAETTEAVRQQPSRKAKKEHTEDTSTTPKPAAKKARTAPKEPSSSSKASVELIKFLKKEKVDALETYQVDNQTISVNADKTLIQTLDVILEKKIHCVPIHDTLTDRALALVDLVDMVHAVVNLFDGVNSKELDSDDFFFTPYENSVNSLPIVKVANLSGRNPFEPVKPTAHLFEVASRFAKDHMHRIPVTDKKMHVVNLITQSALLSHIVTNFELSADIKNRKISAWQSAEKKAVVSVNVTDYVLDAFRLMVSNKVPILGVMKDGQLVETISTSDIELWSEWYVGGSAVVFNNLSTLGQTVDLYLDNHRANITTSRPKEVITVTEDATLEEVMNKLLHNHIHHVFVVDDKKAPTRVVSICDIFRELLL